MALSDAEQAELEALIAKKVAPEPRTETGVAGLLHALIDSASGAVAVRSDLDWAALHRRAEDLAAPPPAPEPAAAPSYGTEDAGFAG